MSENVHNRSIVSKMLPWCVTIGGWVLFIIGHSTMVAISVRETHAGEVVPVGNYKIVLSSLAVVCILIVMIGTWMIVRPWKIRAILWPCLTVVQIVAGVYLFAFLSFAVYIWAGGRL